jgi:hypothetical protein
MVRGILSAAALVALVGPLAPPVLAQDAAKGASLMAEARTALGGGDKIAEIKRVQVNGEFRRAQGNQTLEGDFEIMIEPPDKYLLKEETGNAGGPVAERTQVLNGTEVWDDSSTAGPGGGGFGGGRGGFRGGFGGAANAQPGAAPAAPAIDTERIRDQQRRTRQADLGRWMLAWLMTTDAPVTWIGTAESPDGKADVIEVKPADAPATRVFLDVTTHLPLMLTYDGPAPRGGAAGGNRRGGGGRGAGGAGRGGDFPGGQPGGADGVSPSVGQGAAGIGRSAAPARQFAPAAGQGAPAAAPNQGGQGGRRAGGAQGGGPQTATIEMHLEQYKAVNGIKLPFHISRGVNGQTTEEMTVKNYKLNPNFKANTFTKK